MPVQVSELRKVVGRYRFQNYNAFVIKFFLDSHSPVSTLFMGVDPLKFLGPATPPYDRTHDRYDVGI